MTGDTLTQLGDHNTVNDHVRGGPVSPPLPPATPYQRAVHDRLQSVLDWHGLDAGRATQLLSPHGFAFAAVTDPARAIGLYDEAMVTFLADFLQVARPYLLAQDEQLQTPAHTYTRTSRRSARRRPGATTRGG